MVAGIQSVPPQREAGRHYPYICKRFSGRVLGQRMHHTQRHRSRSAYAQKWRMKKPSGDWAFSLFLILTIRFHHFAEFHHFRQNWGHLVRPLQNARKLERDLVFQRGVFVEGGR